MQKYREGLRVKRNEHRTTNNASGIPLDVFMQYETRMRWQEVQCFFPDDYVRPSIDPLQPDMSWVEYRTLVNLNARERQLRREHNEFAGMSRRPRELRKLIEEQALRDFRQEIEYIAACPGGTTSKMFADVFARTLHQLRKKQLVRSAFFMDADELTPRYVLTPRAEFLFQVTQQPGLSEEVDG